MKLRPAAGNIFITPVEPIPSSRTETGFGGKTDKQKPEQPYKFRVAAVGGPVPINGQWFRTEVEIGDIVSLVSTNLTLREQSETAGFLIDGVLYYAWDFRDILGIWETNEQRQQKINQKLDSIATNTCGLHFVSKLGKDSAA